MDRTSDFAGWSKVSKVYNEIERVTYPLAKDLVARVHNLHSLSSPNTHAFDNGCGTGVLTLALREIAPRCPIMATDASAGMIDIFKPRVKDAGYDGINSRVLDARNLEGVSDDTFSHTFSSFMVCLAPDPDVIVAEMYRVTRSGGMLGLAIWADPYFGIFNGPWTKACRELEPGYEPAAVMEESWTLPKNVRVGLEKAGFRDVEVRQERRLWRWESVGDMARYFFEGGNPGNELMRESFVERGGDVGKARKLFERIVVEDYGVEDDGVEAPVLACLVVARK